MLQTRALATLLLILPACLSLRCYHCWYSEVAGEDGLAGLVMDPKCADPPTEEEEDEDGKEEGEGGPLGDDGGGGGGGINSAVTRECDVMLQEDVCVLIFRSDADGNEFFSRDCGVSDGRYGGETDKCHSADMWGNRVVECVCQGDRCNAATRKRMTTVEMALLLMVLSAGWTLG